MINFFGIKKKYFWKKFKYLRFLLKNINSVSINKKNEQLYYFPTFNDFKTALQTINSVKNDINKIDILIIDNGSDDFKEIKKKFSNINFISLNLNVGSTGAQWVGLYYAIKYKYKKIIISDNDSFMVTKNGLSKMLEFSNSKNNIAISPTNITELIDVNKKNYLSSSFHVSQFFLVNLEKINLKNSFNPIMYLACEDTVLSCRVLNKEKIFKLTDVEYQHPPLKSSNFNSKSIFLKLRALIMIIFFERNINLKINLRIVAMFLFSCFNLIINAFRFNDYNSILLISKSFMSAFNSWSLNDLLYDLNNINKFKYILKISDIKIKNAKELNISNKFFMPKKFKIRNKLSNNFIYYELHKN
jgi:hypothetical protein